MKKIQFLTILCLGLLMTNLILLWFLLYPGTKLRDVGPKKIIMEKLRFDEIQIKEYEKLIVWHRQEILKSERAMHDLKQGLYKTLTSNLNAESKDSLINEIGKLQIDIENTHYRHFQDIKKVCKPEQQKLFDDMTVEITDLFPRNKSTKR